MTTKGVPTWPWMPTANCVKYLAEELSLGGLLKMALTNQSGLPVFLGITDQATAALGKPMASLGYIKAVAEYAAPRAKEQINSGFHLLHVHALINMWGAVSTALEQTIAGCIAYDERARHTALQMLDGRGDMARQLKEDEVSSMASRLIQRATNSRPAHGAYPTLCAKFEMNFDPSKYPFPELEEVRCIRNSLVHKGGIVTQQLADVAPMFRQCVGRQLHLDEASSIRHARALSNFNLALSEAAISSRYCLNRSGEVS